MSLSNTPLYQIIAYKNDNIIHKSGLLFNYNINPIKQYFINVLSPDYVEVRLVSGIIPTVA